MRIDISPRGKQDSIVLPFKMAAVTWSCKASIGARTTTDQKRSYVKSVINNNLRENRIILVINEPGNEVQMSLNIACRDQLVRTMSMN